MKFNSESYCGLDCSGCPVFRAMEAGNKKYFEQAAAQWGTQPVNLMCTGCKTTMIAASCVNCEKKKCAINKEFNSCLDCEEYPCKLFGRRGRVKKKP